MGKESRRARPRTAFNRTTTIEEAEEPGRITHVELGSMFGWQTKKGYVELALQTEDARIVTTMTVGKAREILGMMHGATEAAVSDELMYLFLVQNVGLDEERAGRALLDFRKLRQGTTDVVYPQ
jgi:hypothetical protein